MNLPPLLLIRAVSRNRSPHAPNRTLRTVHSALAQVLQVLAGFSILAGFVLLDALLAQSVRASRVAEGFLRGAQGLVPGAGVLGSGGFGSGGLLCGLLCIYVSSFFLSFL